MVMGHGFKVFTGVIGVKLVMGVKVVLDHMQEKNYYSTFGWSSKIMISRISR